MQVFHQLEDVPPNFGPTVVSVGNFDGVHRAHQHVLQDIVQRARRQKAKSVAITFEPHPVRILRPDSGFKLLTPTPEKLHLLEATGLDAVLLLPFSRDLSLLTPREFAERILRDRLHASEVHEGYNFHFGHKAAGNVQALAEFGLEMGFVVNVFDEMVLRGESVSSSQIRKLLREGQVSRSKLEDLSTRGSSGVFSESDTMALAPDNDDQDCDCKNDHGGQSHSLAVSDHLPQFGLTVGDRAR